VDRREILKGGLKIQDKQACLIHLAQDRDQFWSLLNTDLYRRIQ
jgi:hypothetical protein